MPDEVLFVLRSYKFNDPRSSRGVFFYRLKVVDTDGKFFYSKAVVIKTDRKSGLQIFPNPAKNILYVQEFGNNENVIVQILDVTGRKIREEKISINGNTSFTIDITNFSKGIYNLVLKTNSKTEQQKFVKE